MNISILGIGPVCALGSGINNLWLGLNGKKKPLINNSEENGSFYKTEIEELEKYVSARSLRRLDSFSKMVLLSCFLTVEDSGIKFENPERVGIVLGSGYGPVRTTIKFLDNIIEDGDEFASPILFAGSVHNAPASGTSLIMNIKGPSTTITCFEHTFSNVLLSAIGFLESGMADYVIAGAGDEYHEIFKNNNSEDSCMPGEGFVTFLLSKEKKHKDKYCTINDISIRNNIMEIDKYLDNSSYEENDFIILNNNFNSRSNKIQSILRKFNLTVADYSNLYGRMPAGAVFDLAIAALNIKEKSINDKTKFYCLEAGENNEYNSIMISF